MLSTELRRGCKSRIPRRQESLVGYPSRALVVVVTARNAPGERNAETEGDDDDDDDDVTAEIQNVWNKRAATAIVVENLVRNNMIISLLQKERDRQR